MINGGTCVSFDSASRIRNEKNARVWTRRERFEVSLRNYTVGWRIFIRRQSRRLQISPHLRAGNADNAWEKSRVTAGFLRLTFTAFACRFDGYTNARDNRLSMYLRGSDILIAGDPCAKPAKYSEIRYWRNRELITANIRIEALVNNSVPAGADEFVRI